MAHPDIDASDVEIHIANGIVTLTGTVEDRHGKRLTEYVDAARRAAARDAEAL